MRNIIEKEKGIGKKKELGNLHLGDTSRQTRAVLQKNSDRYSL